MELDSVLSVFVFSIVVGMGFRLGCAIVVNIWNFLFVLVFPAAAIDKNDEHP